MDNSQRILKELHEVIVSFENSQKEDDIRAKVLSLIPAYEKLRELGKSLIPKGLVLSARDRLLSYFLAYPKTVLTEKELSIVAGISEWARRVRELRVEYGWKIITGVTATQMLLEDDFLDGEVFKQSKLGPKDYILLENVQDRDAAYRWNIVNEIRKQKVGSKEKLLTYLKANVGKPVTGEELVSVAKSSEWARRIRELRTEEGWPILTQKSGDPSLPIGVYVLEADRQSPAHDRHIPEGVRRHVLLRDRHQCADCGWRPELNNRSDPRFLELHHKIRHIDKGKNEPDNLMTLCNVCHDEIHRLDNKA